ncbi:aldo/keto reductase [Haloplasma contractile]|uniref:D-threo-aldose 1-dehydrogenase protein n=1 Tax=Haloplasma contractile SSD-17B TaxID=1033810 RepID=U2FLK2_9MOLU|nr:aldo/keto reductase [Haloplasma contractile]ERJ12054.1 D-threo-aldose 1-dehydrogenase protein [Haloplasma contractile SSD-17B]
MNKRAYGTTGKYVSEVSLGAWQLGNTEDWSSNLTEAEAIHLVHKALELGVNFFDTSPNYGLGKSETILGKALSGKRESVIINTKVGHQVNGELDFGIEQMKRSIEGSLTRLQTDYLDSVLLHNPPESILEGKTGHFEALEELKKEGKINAYGASVDRSQDMITLMNNTDSDIIETMFNIFHQETREAFSEASKKNIGIIVKVPLDSGWLTGKYNESSQFDDIRSRWNKDIIKRRFDVLRKVKEIAGVEDDSLVRTALAFILAHKEVTTIIPGAKNIKQLTENVASADYKLSNKVMTELITLWKTELKNDPLPW